MASDLLEMTADIVSAHASETEMTAEELVAEIKLVYATLAALEKGEGQLPVSAVSPGPKKRKGKKAEEVVPEEAAAASPAALSKEEAFQADEVGCLICGKRGLVTLKRHLATAHGVTPEQYRKEFAIPREQPLAAAAYLAKRRQIALDRGLGGKLAAARGAKNPKKTKKAKK